MIPGCWPRRWKLSWSRAPSRAPSTCSTCVWTWATTTPPVADAVLTHQYVPHLRRIGTEKLDLLTGVPRFPARRWVVERTLAWLSKCRALLVRYDKHSANFLGLLQLACALLWFRRLHRLRA